MPLYRAELLTKKIVQPSTLIHDVSQVLHLPFDYDDGSYARDRSGHGNHGTIHGATKTAGKIGVGRYFDGLDDCIDTGLIEELDRVSQMTVVAWVKIASFKERGAVFSKGYDVAGVYKRLSMSLNWTPPYKGVLIYFSDDVNNIDVNAYNHNVFTDADLNKWMVWAEVFDGTKVTNEERLKFFVARDAGLTEISLSYSAAVPSKTPKTEQKLRVAGPGTGTFYFHGTVDEFRAYNRTLTLTELSMLMYRRW